MAIVTTLMSGCYIDGTVEVFAVYNDVTNTLREIVVKGDSGREVDILLDGQTLEIQKRNPQESRFNVASKNLRFFLPTDDISEPEVPPLQCTYYAEKLSRADIIADKLAEANK